MSIARRKLDVSSSGSHVRASAQRATPPSVYHGASGVSVRLRCRVSASLTPRAESGESTKRSSSPIVLIAASERPDLRMAVCSAFHCDWPWRM